MTTSVPRTYVEGALAPVADELTVTELTVTGTLPAELCGRYVRNGPNPLDPDPTTQHWFTGSGMVHGVRLEEGRAAWYRNRFVRTPEVTAALGEPAVPSPRPPGVTDGSVNTNVVGIAGRTFALVEAGSLPVELTEELDTLASVDFGGTLAGSFSAHPHLDPATGRWHAVTYHWTEEAVRHVVVGPDATVERDALVHVGDRPMVHDCAITATSVLLFDFPVTFSLDAAMAGASLPYVWNPDRGARIGVLPKDGEASRASDDVRWCEVPVGYVFHAFNAYDLDDGRVVLDVVVWPKVFDADRLGPSEGPTRIERWHLDPARGAATTDVVADVAVELPRIDERLVGRHHRFGYASVLGTPGGDHAACVAVDFDTGVVEAVELGPTTAVEELVFVAREGGVGERDGWLVGFASDRAEATTDLVVLAADDLSAGPVARVHLPRRAPDGFHGNWLPDAAPGSAS